MVWRVVLHRAHTGLLLAAMSLLWRTRWLLLHIEIAQNLLACTCESRTSQGDVDLEALEEIELLTVASSTFDFGS